MQKKARVTPRNIQFKEHVQIKEIPSNKLHDTSLKERQSWDPHLTEDVFKQKPTKQKNVIIGITICGCVLLMVVIGTALGVVLTTKSSTAADQSLTYNQACTKGSNQCKSSQGLTCPNGFCLCTFPYSWNQGSTLCTLLTYNQACSSSSQCNSSLGLNCTQNTCQCDSYHSWSTSITTCVIILNNTLTYGNTCANGSNQCNSSVSLTCTGNCTCANSKVWNISNCVCPAGTFLNASNLCQSAFTFNDSCLIGSNQCDSRANLICSTNSSSCQCDTNSYWNRNYLLCLPRLNYTEACSQDSDCIPTLSCPSMPGVCNCPQYLPDYVCNCNNAQYYNPSTLQCVSRSTFNGPCITSTNYTCLSNLYCNAGVCACALGTSWISANSSCA